MLSADTLVAEQKMFGEAVKQISEFLVIYEKQFELLSNETLKLRVPALLEQFMRQLDKFGEVRIPVMPIILSNGESDTEYESCRSNDFVISIVEAPQSAQEEYQDIDSKVPILIVSMESMKSLKFTDITIERVSTLCI